MDDKVASMFLADLGNTPETIKLLLNLLVSEIEELRKGLDYSFEIDGKPVKATHRKKGYNALAVKWDGTNREEIERLYAGQAVLSATPLYLTIRYKDAINTLLHGDFVVRGENGSMKIYKPDAMQVKYESVNGGS
jgi:hypothetical protein